MRRRLITLALLAMGLAFTAAPAGAAPKFKLKPVATAIQPTVVTTAPGQPKLLYVVQRQGRIRIIRNGRFLARDFLDISRRVSTEIIEQGLLGLAFPPDYARSRRFYIHYVNRAGNVEIDEYERDAKQRLRASPTSRRVVLRIREPFKNGGHYGGHLQFRGNQLYIAVGDGSSPGDADNLAQNLNSLRGKILRIIPERDPDTGRGYQVPASNPLVGRPGANEIFAWGLRNPHSFSFHKPPDGPLQMMIADVGQNRYEEINYVPFTRAWGGNFGWKYYEGIKPYDCGPELCPFGGPMPQPPAGPAPADLIWPALTYSHEQGCAVIGGPVVTDPGLPSLAGQFLYGDYCRTGIRSARPPAPAAGRKLLDLKWPKTKSNRPLMTGISTDRSGHIYLYSWFGPIYRLLEVPPQVKRPATKKKRRANGKKRPVKKGKKPVKRHRRR